MHTLRLGIISASIINYYLSGYVCKIIMAVDEEKLQGFTKGTDLALVTLKKIMNGCPVGQLCSKQFESGRKLDGI